ncbi:MAG: iron-sulfur cluster assembly protein [Alphaproteobacteria bacterium]|nr:iron-sulfur cluster assembly protein [Alphaproteobacteria bacterium]
MTLSLDISPELADAVLDQLRGVFDPEIPVNIVELGLIYDLRLTAPGILTIDMTLTAPNCPVAEELPAQVRAKALTVPDLTDCQVNLVWTPPWTQDRMSESARLELGMF